ncbi:MAG: hypothetical protein NTZ87_03995 [Candidatus Nomurabacteria bacterium]|nr:hypothetical protein [Candidatus Nomurabacteria bacterium]
MSKMSNSVKLKRGGWCDDQPPSKFTATPCRRPLPHQEEGLSWPSFSAFAA